MVRTVTSDQVSRISPLFVLDVVYVSDTDRTYIALRGADANPVLVDLNSVLHMKPVAVGATGSRGIPGADGVGVRGAQGPAGPQGKQGPQGAKGDVGAQGATGPAGHNGVDGRHGIDGRPGRDGIDGKDGRDGKDGTPGQRGEKGERGDITVVGDVELQAALAKLKAQKAAALAITIDVLSRRPSSPAASVARAHLTRVKKALEN